MKALITKSYRYQNKTYKLVEGKEIPEMPDGLKKVLLNAGYLEAKKSKVSKQKGTIAQQEHNIEEEEVFVNLAREEDK